MTGISHSTKNTSSKVISHIGISWHLFKSSKEIYATSKKILAFLDPIIVDITRKPQVMMYTLSRKINTILSKIGPQWNISYGDLTLEQVISSENYLCRQLDHPSGEDRVDFLSFIPAIISKRHCLLAYGLNGVPDIFLSKIGPMEAGHIKKRAQPVFIPPMYQ